MAETIDQHEATPATYPTEGDDALWARIEVYCARRWTARSVVWIVDGPGPWKPPLSPVTITGAEIWRNGAYEPATPETDPMGGLYLQHRTYRITGTVGADNPAPALVMEAFARLKAYLDDAGGAMPAGVSAFSKSIDNVTYNYRRSPDFIAKALILSGAADLLRPYRRA